jgi:hypothetical protein
MNDLLQIASGENDLVEKMADRGKELADHLESLSTQENQQ